MGDIDRMAKILMDAWAKAEPNHGVTKHPTSYVATFADMARAALDAAEARDVGVPDDASDYAAARKYAAYLAQRLREQHYPNNTTWRPMPDLLGLLTQIDNMVAGALHPTSPLGAVALAEVNALVDAVSALGLRKLVAGWNGENRDKPYAPHPPRLGVTLKTNAGTVYAIDAALAPFARKGGQ